jgi:hypothetical protein
MDCAFDHAWVVWIIDIWFQAHLQAPRTPDWHLNGVVKNGQPMHDVLFRHPIASIFYLDY